MNQNAAQLPPEGWTATNSRDAGERRVLTRVPDEDLPLPKGTDLRVAAIRDWYPNSLLKRSLDIAIAAAVLVIMLPILAVVALAIKMTSKGPVIFVQERVGQGGKLFKMYKFRTMVSNAEALKAELTALNEMDGPVFKIKKDPRITAVGGFLRKSSLDEFPQLINVIRGDMSLVGPRPPLKSEVERYKAWQTRRLAVKPGITCSWQVSGRNEIQFEDWMRMDIRYISQCSLLQDARLLLQTAVAVFSRRGAC